MQPADIAAIARGLSEAQRHWLLSLWGARNNAFYPGRAHRACVALEAAGLLDATTDSVGNILYRLTPLGLAVRDHLLSKDKNDG